MPRAPGEDAGAAEPAVALTGSSSTTSSAGASSPESSLSALELTLTGRGALEGFGANGAWLAVCEERAAQTQLHFLERTSAGAQPSARVVDAALGWSRSGRYVVLERDGGAFLHDTERGFALALAPLDPALEKDELPDHRSFSFSDDEGELAVLTRGDRSVRLIELRGLDETNAAARLASARQLELPTAAWRVTFQEASLVITHATGDGGPRAWPVPRANQAARRCALSGARFSAYTSLSEPNAAFKRRVSLVGPQRERVEEAPGFVFAFGSGWVRREGDGRLLLVQGRVQKQIASSRCGARILHADSSRGLFLAACEEYRPAPAPSPQKPGARKKPPALRFPLYLLAPGYVRELELDAMRTGVDVPPAPRAPGEKPQRFVPLRPGTETVLVDFEARRPVPQSSDTFVLQSLGDSALLRRGERLFRWTAKGETALTLPWLRLTPTWLSGPWFAQGELLIDWLDDQSSPLPSHELWGLAPSGALVSVHAEGERSLVRLTPGPPRAPRAAR